ncbi:hypothetical protein H2198_001502 [Neophaeococcomyces mojaviensis]|uniref:Uncharacterized protein n=1 Tax=Neophaeococcomyces mojaviensis TaxID=3383035 RepID=A0ACC3AGQ8_9EURO|nr:hypothetical protein H2198_001502 [Knufia sp. JES_112]
MPAQKSCSLLVIAKLSIGHAQAMQSGLKVLTIHGQGLQGLSIISIIDELCSRIAHQNRLARCLAPCEFYDVICGTGIGAFIAVLLGRYCLDISRCKQVYMDLTEFIGEKKQMRFSNTSNAHTEKEHIQEFMEMLIRDEGWSDKMDISVSGNKSRCQHVFIVQHRSSSVNGAKELIFHSDTSKVPESCSLSVVSPSTPSSISAAVAASVTHGIEEWHTDIRSPSDRKLVQIHGVVLAAIEDILRCDQSESHISFLVNVGPSRPNSVGSLFSRKGPISPRKWVADKTSPIKSVVMWPMKQTKKTLSRFDSSSQQNFVIAHPTSFRPRERTVSLPATSWVLQPRSNLQGELASPTDQAERIAMAKEHMQILVELASEKLFFDFTTMARTTMDEASDMVDLRETRSAIKALIDSLDKNGKLAEAARQFGVISQKK